MRWLSALLLVCVCILGATLPVAGAEPAERPSLEIPQTPNAFPDKEAWDSAATIKDLIAPLGVGLRPETQHTSVQLLWNADFLFVKFHCQDGHITPLSQEPSGRDAPYHRADCVEIFLDPVGDAKAFMEIQVGPDNGLFDAMHLCTGTVQSQHDFLLTQETIDREMWFSTEWNLDGLKAIASVESEGWNVVIALPAKSTLRRLGKTHFESGMRLRANFVRLDYASAGSKAIITNWAPVVEGRVHRSPTGMGFVILK